MVELIDASAPRQVLVELCAGRAHALRADAESAATRLHTRESCDHTGVLRRVSKVRRDARRTPGRVGPRFPTPHWASASARCSTAPGSETQQVVGLTLNVAVILTYPCIFH